MALLLFTGVAGTGKTLYAIQRYIIPELQKENHIYTNIDGIKLSRIAILFDIDIIQLERCFHILKEPARFWEELKQNSMCVLDEAQNVFNNRDWQSRNSNDCIKYLMEHRHYGHQILMVTPHVESVDAGIRRVAEFTYKHKSFSAIGAAKTVKTGIFNNANLSTEPLKTFTWKHDTRVYDCYASYFKENTIEKKVRVNAFGNPKLIIFGLLVLAGVIWSGISMPRMMAHVVKHKVKKHIEVVGKMVPELLGKSQVIKINDSLLVGEKGYRRAIR